MTTADGMQPAFSGRHTQLFISSDMYRVLTDIAEVNTDIARSVLKFIIPLLPLVKMRDYFLLKHFMDAGIVWFISLTS